MIAFTADDQARFRRGRGEETLTVASADSPNGKVFRTVPSFFTGSYHMVREINPTAATSSGNAPGAASESKGQGDAAASPVEITLSLTSGADVLGKIVDPDGKPLSGTIVTGQSAYQKWLATKDDMFRVEGYYPDLGRELYFYHPGAISRATSSCPQHRRKNSSSNCNPPPPFVAGWSTRKSAHRKLRDRWRRCAQRKLRRREPAHRRRCRRAFRNPRLGARPQVCIAG